MTWRERVKLRKLLKWAALSSFCFALSALWGAFSCAHGGFGILLMPLFFFALALPLVMVPFSLLCLTWKRTRVAGFQMLVLGLIWFTVGVPSVLMERPIRQHVFEEVAEGSAPLVEALHAYQHDHDRPAAELEDLVGDYIDAIPHTGLEGFPEFTYEADPLKQSWSLNISVSSGILNWDQFMYWSSEEYPYHYATGRIERIGRWAYLHE